MSKNNRNSVKNSKLCPVSGKCGACCYLDMTYEKQLAKKQKQMEELLGRFGEVSPIIGMENPLHYRNKVHVVVDRKRVPSKKGSFRYEIVTGTYKKGTHDVVPIDTCAIEDEQCREIIKTIEKLIKDFKLRVYDEDLQNGLIRHILLRKGFATGEIMVVLVLAEREMQGKNNFLKALRAAHPEITTIVFNFNNKKTSMVLGERSRTVFGKGYITDILCGCRFRISPDSFYQVNPVQTEKLYETAIEFAYLTGTETVIDAYCGIGTIGIVASKLAKRVVGVELNKDAVKDAKTNAAENKIDNAEFYCGDSTEFMLKMAAQGNKADVVIMDPPRSGSTEKFLDAVERIGAQKVVYVSCGPDTLARDLKVLVKKGFEIRAIQPVDMFPMTEHVETVVLLNKVQN